MKWSGWADQKTELRNSEEQCMEWEMLRLKTRRLRGRKPLTSKEHLFCARNCIRCLPAPCSILRISLCHRVYYLHLPTDFLWLGNLSQDSSLFSDKVVTPSAAFLISKPAFFLSRLRPPSPSLRLQILEKITGQELLHSNPLFNTIWAPEYMRHRAKNSAQSELLAS